MLTSVIMVARAKRLKPDRQRYSGNRGEQPHDRLLLLGGSLGQGLFYAADVAPGAVGRAVAVKANRGAGNGDDVFMYRHPAAQSLIVAFVVTRVAEILLAVAFPADLRIFAA
jgi:hypothetical protein